MVIRIILIVALSLCCAAQEPTKPGTDTPTQPQSSASAPTAAQEPATPAAKPESTEPAKAAEPPASTEPKTVAPELAKATVYIYRYKQFVGSALEPSVYCDDVQLARMDNGRYLVMKIDPGEHVFRANDKQAGVVLKLKAGEVYYVRVEIVSGFMKGHGRVVHATPEQGAYEVKKLQPLGPEKIIDKTMVVPAANVGM